MSIDTQSTPTLTLTSVAESFVGDNGLAYDCSGTINFTSQVAAGGAWLLDLKFADNSGKVIPDRVALVNGVTNPTSKNSIVFTPPAGYTDQNGQPMGAEAFTQMVLGRMTYLPDDPSKPYFPQSTIPSTATWTDSLNWKWDPSTWTGDTWLPAGTQISVKRHVTYAGCTGAGFSTDGDTYRGYGMAIEIARPITTTSASAETSFKLPGAALGVACETHLYYSQSGNVGSSGTTYVGWQDMTAWPNATTADYHKYTTANPRATQGVAIAKQRPDILVYSQVQNADDTTETWNWINTTDGTKGTYSWTTPSYSRSDAMAFDPEGDLWIVGVQITKNWLGQETSRVNRLFEMRYVDGVPTGTWVDHGLVTFSETGIYSSPVDILFDAAGNMYLLNYYGGRIYKLTSSQLAGSSSSNVTPTRSPSSPTPSTGTGQLRHGLEPRRSGSHLQLQQHCGGIPAVQRIRDRWIGYADPDAGRDGHG